MFPARRLLLACLALVVFALPGRALPGFLSESADHVRASLVAADASVQPGQPLQVALRLQHDAKWHTYWENPGTGMATSLTWQLPPGWTAGAIQWPAPGLIRDHTGAITGYGYEGDVLLPVTLIPPATLEATEVNLVARAEWLMCAEICVPGGAEVSVRLPVSRERAQPSSEWSAKIQAALADVPARRETWQITARPAGDGVELTAQAAAGAQSHAPRDVWFYTLTPAIAYDQPQTARAPKAGEARLALPPGAPGGAKVRGVLVSENGWAPGEPRRGLLVDATLAAAAPSGGAVPAGSLTAGVLLLAFAGGLILNLMPCVFPVIGLKVLGFVKQAGHDRKRVVGHALIFAAGVLLSFWALAGTLAVLRAGGEQLGWGFQLQSAGFVYALALTMLVFGLNLSGVFEVGLRATSVGSELQTKSGLSGSFFSGVLATVVATPCSAPFLAPALGAALSVSASEAFVVFTAIGLGLSAPYLALSVFPQAAKALPRPGAWMETFKQFIAFPLYATTAYLAWVLAAQTSEEGLRAALFSFVGVALAAWIYGRTMATDRPAKRRRLAWITATLLAALALAYGWPRPLAAGGAPGTTQSSGITWEPWSPEAVARLRAEGRTIYVDFTARWCATCQTNKALVFGSEQVRRLFAARSIATLRADWTNRDPRITAELARYGRSAVPFNVIWRPGETEPVILPELLTPGLVLEALTGPEPRKAD